MSDMVLSRSRVQSRVLQNRSMKAVSTTATSVMLAVMLVPAAATAQQEDLSRCLGISDIEQRVRCYDAIAQSQLQTGGATPVPATEPSVPVPPAQPAAPPSAVAQTAQAALPTFGLSAAQREAQRDPAAREQTELRASVAAVERAGAGLWRFELSDGTVWELTEMRRNFRIPRVGDDIAIRRGSLGAFYLDADRQPTIRIRRVV